MLWINEEVMMTEIYTVEGGQKDVSSLEGTIFFKKLQIIFFITQSMIITLYYTMTTLNEQIKLITLF